MIDEMDQGIGMAVKALKDSGKFDKTLIFFLSDNGGAASVPSKKVSKSGIYSSSGPFRDGKGSLREGGSHVQFIVHWSAGIKKSGEFTGLVSSLDIAATAVALGNGDTSGHALDGVNLIPYLNGEKSGSPHQALFWRTDLGQWAVRTENSKYLLAGGKNGKPEFYDMQKDPYESNNIVDISAEKRAELAKLWNEWNSGNINNILLQAGAYQQRRLDFYKELYKELKEKSEKQKNNGDQIKLMN